MSGKPDNPAAPFRGYFHQLRELKRRYPHLKILISLEGAAASFAEDAKPASRVAFVASCVDTFLRGHFGPGVVEPVSYTHLDVYKRQGVGFEEQRRNLTREESGMEEFAVTPLVPDSEKI